MSVTRQMPQPAGTRPDLLSSPQSSRLCGWVYRCHAGSDGGVPLVRSVRWGVTTPYPGHALCWVRAQVRALLPALDPETRNAVAGWLDDLVAAGVAVRDLREGRPHIVTLGPQGNRRWWVIHPAAPTFCHSLMDRQGGNADTLLHTRLDHAGGTDPTETDTVWHLARAVAPAPSSRPARPGGHPLPHETAER